MSHVKISSSEQLDHMLTPCCDLDRWGSVAAGGLLAGLGLGRRAPWGGCLMLLGGLLALRGLSAFRLAEAGKGPRLEGLLEPRQPEPGADAVEEASWESFPASDPPASY